MNREIIIRENLNRDILINRVLLRFLSEEAQDRVDIIPYRDFMGLKIAYYLDLGTEDNEHRIVLVDKRMISKMKITEEELYNAAKDNTEKMNGFHMMTLPEVLGYLRSNEESQIFVITNNNSFLGASVILYEGVLEEISEKIGNQGFYILPSSIHEMLIVSDRWGMHNSELSEMVSSINQAVVDTRDRLSDHIYHFDNTLKIIEYAEEYESRMRKLVKAV